MIEGHIINEAESERAVLVGLITPTQNEMRANEYLDELPVKVFQICVLLDKLAAVVADFQLFLKLCNMPAFFGN